MSREPESRWTVPNSWVWTKLSALGDIVAGGTPSTKEPTYWADEISWISPADLTGYSAKTIKRGAKSISRIGLANSSAKVMPAGSVHFSTRAPIGHVVISSEPLATNQGFKSLVPAPGIFNDYVYYYLMASRDYARKRGSGTTFLELSGRAFGELPIPLAPTATQHKVVAKIEELFSELDKGIESLKAARAKLNVYRQAVLKHAFEGKLTAQWREENKDKLEKPEQLLARIKQEREARYEQQLKDWKAAVKEWEAEGKLGKKPSKPRKPITPDKPRSDQLDSMWKVPPTWQWLQVGNFAFVTKLAGFEYTKSVEYDDDGDLPVIKAENAGPNGFRATRYSYVKSESVQHLTRSCLEGGELLMVFVGAGTGNVATVPRNQAYFLGPNIGMIRPETQAIKTRYVEVLPPITDGQTACPCFGKGGSSAFFVDGHYSPNTRDFAVCRGANLRSFSNSITSCPRSTPSRPRLTISYLRPLYFANRILKKPFPGISSRRTRTTNRPQFF